MSKQKKHTLTITISGKGTTEPIQGKYIYDDGEQVTIIASPSSGYSFERWEGDASGASREVTIPMDGSKNVAARFVVTPKQSRWKFWRSLKGFIIFISGLIGAAAALIAILSAMGIIEVGPEPAPVPAPAPAPAPAPPPAPAPTPAPAPAPAPAPTIYYDITISVDGKGTTNPVPGSHTYDKGAQVSVTALSDDEWEFDHWGGDASGTSPSITITMTSDKNITAYFTKFIMYSLSTSVSPLWSGSVSPSSGTYDAGIQVNVTATPALGQKFDHWGGDASGTSPSITITMTSDKNITAYFTPFYSSNTQLFVARSGISTIGNLKDGKIVVVPGASWNCAVVALDTYEITTYQRITIPTGEIYNALSTGLIDAALVAGHPSMFVPEDVNILGWSDAAIQAVTNEFPEMVATLLEAGTYRWQGADIKGYALR